MPISIKIQDGYACTVWDRKGYDIFVGQIIHVTKDQELYQNKGIAVLYK